MAIGIEDERRQGQRSIEAVELAKPTYAEVKAHSPRAIRTCGFDADIARYSSLFSV